MGQHLVPYNNARWPLESAAIGIFSRIPEIPKSIPTIGRG